MPRQSHPDEAAKDVVDNAPSNTGDKRQNAVTGTRVLPMPSDSETVAGMPRADRVHTEPGDPGTVQPEKQVAPDQTSSRT